MDHILSSFALKPKPPSILESGCEVVLKSEDLSDFREIVIIMRMRMILYCLNNHPYWYFSQREIYVHCTIYHVINAFQVRILLFSLKLRHFLFFFCHPTITFEYCYVLGVVLDTAKDIRWMILDSCSAVSLSLSQIPGSSDTIENMVLKGLHSDTLPGWWAKKLLWLTSS